MKQSLRLQSILTIKNFDTAFNWAFCIHDNPSFQINSQNLRDNLFREIQAPLSESELDLICRNSFQLQKLCEELNLFASSHLTIVGKKVYALIDDYPRWKAMSLQNGQDIFVSVFLKNVGIYDWDYIIPAKSSELDSALSNGYAENHCHIAGAGPIFQINWLFLHNTIPLYSTIKILNSNKIEFLKYYSEEEFNTLRNLSALVIYLRRFLFNLINKNKDIISTPIQYTNKILFRDLKNENPSFINTFINAGHNLPFSSLKSGKQPLFDYAASNECDEPLYGERVLLCKCFQSYEKWNRRNQAIFYLYIICKKYFIGFFLQNNLRFGFRNFKRYERMGELFIPKNNTTSCYINSNAYSMLLENDKLKKLEVRTSIKSNYKDALLRIKTINPDQFFYRNTYKNSAFSKHNKTECRFGLVLHFIKTNRLDESQKENKFNCVYLSRFGNKLWNYEMQSNIIVKLISHYHDQLFPLVGVDAANEELYCRPEVFAPFYRKIRYYNWEDISGCRHYSNLHFTFHVGEDFVSLADGLRAIYESIIYLDLSDGDRIGHASALGTNADRYFSLKGNRIFQMKQDLLDDYCFLLHMLISTNSNSDYIAFFEKEIDNLLIDIYGYCKRDSYIRSLLLRSDHPYVYRISDSQNDYYKNKLRLKCDGLNHYIQHSPSEEYLRSWSDGIAINYIKDYQFSSEVRDRGDYVCEKNINDIYVEAIKIAQKEVASLLVKRSIGIETNPTSNYLIGPFSEFEDIPAVFLTGLHPSMNYLKDIRLSIGTDDPALFETSLRNEYASMYYYLKESNILKGQSLIDYLKKLSSTSIELSFIQ